MYTTRAQTIVDCFAVFVVFVFGRVRLAFLWIEGSIGYQNDVFDIYTFDCLAQAVSMTIVFSRSFFPSSPFVAISLLVTHQQYILSLSFDTIYTNKYIRTYTHARQRVRFALKSINPSTYQHKIERNERKMVRITFDIAVPSQSIMDDSFASKNLANITGAPGTLQDIAYNIVQERSNSSHDAGTKERTIFVLGSKGVVSTANTIENYVISKKFPIAQRLNRGVTKLFVVYHSQ